MSRRHLNVSLIFFIISLWGALLGSSLSIVIRLELQRGGRLINSNVVYNSVVTLHGIVMIFFFIIPSLIGGFGNFLLPVLLRAADIVLPRVNNRSLVTAGGSTGLLVIRMFVGVRLGLSWVIYPPLSTVGNPEVRVDCLIFSLHLRGVSSLLGSINYMRTSAKGSSNSLSVEHLSIFV